MSIDNIKIYIISEKGKCMSIFISMLKGEHDGLLKWPYTGRLLFSLLDQSESRDNHNVLFEPENMQSENKFKCLCRPDNVGNPSIGLYII